MSYYNTCLLCGANLDPDEKCDCESTQDKNQNFKEDKNNGNHSKCKRIRRTNISA